MQPYFLQNFHKLYETINKDELNDDDIAQFEKLVRTYNINKNNFLSIYIIVCVIKNQLFLLA